jgi:ribulose-5-phosphate 4-epimerase/fuculose-1-phosphate aldolase
MTAAARTEHDARVDLAAAHRLAARAGWDDTVWTHVSASVPGRPGHYLIAEFGLGFDEVRPQDLVIVDVDGRVVDGSGRRVNPSGFAIHGAVHRARPEVECVMHLHTDAGVALSMLPDGLLPLSQWALRLHGRLGRHRYAGLAFDATAQARLAADLGDLDGLVLEHHGTLTVGRTVAEAYLLMHLLEKAARAQLTAQAAAGGRLPGVDGVTAALTQRQWIGDGSERDGDVEWPMLLRRLDRTDPGWRG